MTRHRYTNGHVVTSLGVLPGAEISVEGDRICDIVPLKSAADAIDLGGGWLMPGFIDVQVNGGGGVLFNDQLDVDGIAKIGASHARFGTTAFLPTLISEDPDHIAAALDAVDAAIRANIPGVVGVHIEGPVLNKVRKGIHDERKFRPLDAKLINLLCQPRAGRVVVTLAPEMSSPEALDKLISAGVIVSAGHSDADYETSIAAFDRGVTGVTHLFNAMSPFHHRAPGLAGAALEDARPWCGLIVDGAHVAPPTLRVAMGARPLDRMMLVTDAMPSVGSSEKAFALQGKQIHVSNGRCLDSEGRLAGSDLDMATAVANCVALLGLAPEQASAMASGHPAAFLRLAHERGSLKPGLRADWVQLDSKLKPVATYIALALA